MWQHPVLKLIVGVEMSKFMQCGDQKCVWVQIAIHCDLMFLTRQASPEISKLGFPSINDLEFHGRGKKQVYCIVDECLRQIFLKCLRYLFPLCQTLIFHTLKLREINIRSLESFQLVHVNPRNMS